MRTATVAIVPLLVFSLVLAQTERAPAVRLYEPPTLASPAPSASASPAATPTPVAVRPSNEATAVGLPEIGRVRVTTPFCSTLRSSTAVAADSAMAFEFAVLVTMADLVRFEHADNMLLKNRLDDRVDDDLRRLADLSREGGAELGGLRTLATTATPEEGKELLGLRDSLDGAKNRQHFMVKKLAYIAGAVKARGPSGFVSAEMDRFLELIGPSNEGIPLEAAVELQTMLPDNDDHEIRADLETAALHAHNAVDLGNCASETAEAASAPLPPPLREMTPAP